MLLAAWTVMHLYVFRHAATVPWLRRLVPGRIMALAGVVIWASFFVPRIFGRDGTGILTGWLELFGMHWMALLFLVTVALLAVDLVTGFGFFMPRLAPTLRGMAILTGVLLAAIALVQGLRPPVVREYEVRLEGLPASLDGTTLVALSDLHLGSTIGPRWLAARLDQVLALHPDVVVLLGDIIEGHGRPAGELLPVLRRITAPLGVWAVTGNHESHGIDDAGVRLLEEAGFRVLHDRWEELRPGLVVAGVDYASTQRRSGQEGNAVGRTLAGRPPGATVFLSHAPWQAERAAEAGVGLMLSGHTHGGQIWPFGYLVRLSTSLLGGRYEVGGMTVIVCRGAGTWGPRMRLWRPGEILRVTLRAPGARAGVAC